MSSTHLWNNTKFIGEHSKHYVQVAAFRRPLAFHDCFPKTADQQQPLLKSQMDDQKTAKDEGKIPDKCTSKMRQIILIMFSQF